MTIFLIIYGIIALIWFIVFYYMSESINKQKNKFFTTNIFHTSIIKLVISSIFFPFTLIIVWIDMFIDSNLRKK